MRIEFSEVRSGPEHLLAEACIHFDDRDGILAGTRLAGFDVVKDREGEVFVVLPARRFTHRGDERVFEFLRGGDGGVGALRRCKGLIISAYHEWARTRSAEVPGMEQVRQSFLPGMEALAAPSAGQALQR